MRLSKFQFCSVVFFLLNASLITLAGDGGDGLSEQTPLISVGIADENQMDTLPTSRCNALMGQLFDKLPSHLKQLPKYAKCMVAKACSDVVAIAASSLQAYTIWTFRAAIETNPCDPNDTFCLNNRTIFEAAGKSAWTCTAMAVGLERLAFCTSRYVFEHFLRNRAQGELDIEDFISLGTTFVPSGLSLIGSCAANGFLWRISSQHLEYAPIAVKGALEQAKAIGPAALILDSIPGLPGIVMLCIICIIC